MNYVLVIYISTICLTTSLANHYNIQNRIVGGKKAKIKNYPYQISLIIKRSTKIMATDFKGAAVIVSSLWALTSANNIAFIDKKLFDAGLVYLRGNVAKWNVNQNYIDHQIIKTRIHPKYQTYSRDYNVALVKVLNPYIGANEKSIQVVGKGYKYVDNLPVTIAGWGKIAVGQKGPTYQLRAANVNLMNQKECNQKYSKGFISPLTPRMICSRNNGRDSCIYDSGGAMVHKTKGKSLLLGIISWGRGCADSLLPEIYTRISEFYDWIKIYEKEIKEPLNITFF